MTDMNLRTSQLIDFHAAMKVPMRAHPSVPTDDRVRLRLALVSEEFFELLDACLERKPGSDHMLRDARQIIEHAVRMWPVRVDLPEVADALADIDYVVEGMRLEFGIDGAPIAQLVHAANMANASGPRRADGKVLKPNGWVAPDIAGELRRQGWGK